MAARAKQTILSDWARRAKNTTFDFEKYLIRSLLHNRYAPVTSRARSFVSLVKHCRHYAYVSARSCCRLSGRSHFVLQKSGLGRIFFREISGSGVLCGVRRTGK